MSQASVPPPLVTGLPMLGRPPVLVTGAAGTLGRDVVAELQRSQVPVRALAHTSEPPEGVVTAPGDLTTGVGLAEAVTDIGAVIHCATGESVDVDGTRRLADACAAQGVRLVHVSIVGCWDNPLPYYRTKAQSETEVVASGAPHAIVRATQFHSLVRTLFGPRHGVSVSSRGLRAAPCDTAWVARVLVDVALEDRLPVEPIELAGPEVLTAREIAVLTAHVTGEPLRRHLQVPAVGGIMRAFARGSNLPGPGARRGGRTYAAWLAAQTGAARS
ncbi:NAD(P)H-binding protein [Calidifontibacter sp. DB0510]|uniref:NAD(P)H-binding protein n=1 Tax=Metallococcus carri TaxID=1656884 RepID=A0A967E975_9MICO|nr:NAD(P)H-binding protein [Metallococcus carri]NHN54574.1 NAD(P)H-binding protein [Metallococcus carri]NOP36587.1 NAD(P)H-binding protein [Calidifontibacter sp. DB2511S]